MTIKTTFALLVLVAGAVPLSAQVSTRQRTRDRVIYGDGRTTARTGGGIGDIIYGRTGTNTTTSRSKIPPGQLPPRGMCRVWVDGVPPGQQPPVTSCAQAERDRLQYGTRARVIYGDVQSFPGKGKGKHRNRNTQAVQQCSIWDVVVVGGQQRNVCRDANGNVIDQNGNVIRGGRGRGDDENEADDDRDEDRFEARGHGDQGEHHGKAGKSHGKGKHGGDE